MDFNLLDKNWIPVLYRDGRWQGVGICKALADARRIRAAWKEGAADD
jgi:hypothetical protein